MKRFFFILLILSFLSCEKTRLNLWIEKGKKHYQNDKLDLSSNYFFKALEIDSTNLEARYYISLIQFKRGHIHDACETWVKLKKQNFTIPDSLFTLSGCHYFE